MRERVRRRLNVFDFKYLGGVDGVSGMDMISNDDGRLETGMMRT